MSFSDSFWLLSALTWLICPCFTRCRVFLGGISGYMARKSGSKVVGTLDLEPGSWDPEPGSWDPEPGGWDPEPRGGGAAVFSGLGQGSFRRTTPVEFDKYSKALYPLTFQELLFWLLQLLEFVKGVNPAGRCW
ncbi:hypothetical protein F2Q69_00007471 [Brassica cretica]|uniref:Chlorophyll a-b binding protein, chloroplastic n=1 Tax=Brassica cretica TaxID=69181 RepID=A0A8S9PEU3_BRACR|nr:hypothetical protein F2Q69_00007471 [Brassica cretica]